MWWRKKERFDGATANCIQNTETRQKYQMKAHCAMLFIYK